METFGKKETVFGKSRDFYYRAVIVDVREVCGITEYRLHYTNWSSKHDEWKNAKSLLKYTPENELLVKKLFSEANKQASLQKSQKYGKKTEEFEVEEEKYSQKEKSSKMRKDVRSKDGFLERNTTFKADSQVIANRNFSDCFRIVECLKDYFNLCLGPVLLTEVEYTLYSEVSAILERNKRIMTHKQERKADAQEKDDLNALLPSSSASSTPSTSSASSPSASSSFSSLQEKIPQTSTNFSDVYGGEHLLRLFIKLPYIFANHPDFQKKEYTTQLTETLHDILNFLETYQRLIFNMPRS
ncbi:putative MRG [Monocercomonoides exilis]|uniref:putative MRG n=1 Tax=Monocercomonoides exilis TaxID=2049356 RepID=UPI0035597540|nr:putative MRG [Monocercomonoides exilis]